MKKLSLIISLLGLFALLLTVYILPPKLVSSKSQLPSLISNQKILIEGKVIKEIPSKNKKILYLSNNLSLECPMPCPSLLNKDISSIAKLESYNDRYYLKILKLSYKS